MSRSLFRRSLVLLTLLGAALGISACADPQAADSAAADGSMRGELVVYAIDQMDGASETQFFLRTADAVERRLLFDLEPDLAPGAQLKVWGLPEADGLRVTNYRSVEASTDLGTVSSALKTGSAYPPRTFAFILVDTGGGVNTTKDEVMNLMMNNPGSVRSYYQYASYGRQDISVEVFGPIKYTMTGCGTSKLSTDLRPMIPGNFQHYLWYLGSRNAGCGWSGLASVGTPDKPSRDTWYNASTGCVVLVQEPGHNFGMAHSSSMTCGTETFVDNPMATCKHSEYGDRFDPMGGGCRHMNAWQKSYQGWYGACNGVKVGSSGTFTLLSNGRACDGAQFLQIPAPKVRMMPRSGGGGSASVDMLSHYYVEFRAPDNFDGALGWRNMPQAALTPQVHVRVGGDLRSRTQRGLHTWLLDMTPTTTSNTDAALVVGKTFTDPAGGLSITVMAADANSATIKVDLAAGAGMNTCIDGTPFQAPGPGPESCGVTMVGGDAGVPLPTDSGPVMGGRDGGVDVRGTGGAGGAGGGGMIGGSGGAMADAGQSGSGGAPANDSGTVTGPPAADSGTTGVTGNTVAGCGCRTGGQTAPVSLGTLALAMSLALARRRKRHH